MEEATEDQRKDSEHSREQGEKNQCSGRIAEVVRRRIRMDMR